MSAKRSEISISFDNSFYNATPEDNDQELLSQQTQKYLASKKDIYIAVLDYLESSEWSDEYFDNLIKIIDAQHLEKVQEEYEHFLYMIEHISNNHHRDETFIKKVFQIMQHYKPQIKQTLSNTQIFKIFQNNKKILLFLIENEIIKLDANIADSINNQYDKNGNRYRDFFYPELKPFLDQSKIKAIESYLLSENENIFDNFDENRHIGENNSYICTLIRQDSVEDFISHVNRTNINLKSEIIPSIFETNRFLNEKNPTLIEYAAFFGSIQIFRYLMMNKVELTPSLWLYTIHSKNAELIHLLESNNVSPPKCNKDNGYVQCLIESIKCHHNDISEYVKNNLIEFDKMNSIDYENTISCILHYHNYFNFPTEFDKDDEFFYLYKFNYNELVQIFLKKKEKFIIKLLKEKKRAIKLSKKTNYKIFILYYSMLKQKNKDTNIYNNNSVIEKITIPSSVTSIGDYAFSGCSSLTQITIPPSVAEIGISAFSGCSSLIQITIPSSVTSIGDYAFSGCSSLTQITIPSSVTSIGILVFLSCLKLDKISIDICDERRIEYIEDKFLVLKKNLTSEIFDTLVFTNKNVNTTTIPSFINKIYGGAFCGCSSLTQITIPSSVTSIGDYAFSYCSSLTQIIFAIPSSVTLIENWTFFECSSLTQITIPSSVIKIGNCAFYRCSSLTQITIPSSVTEIGYCAFFRCSSLTQITIPSSVTSIGDDAFYECSSLTQISIPSSVTSIGKYAFYECSSLTQISIPSSLTSIGKYAFSRCSSLTQISIPSSVTSIGDSAFRECSSLTQISIPSLIDLRNLSIPSIAKVTTY